MKFNEAPAVVSCNRLPLYDGELTLIPHQGHPRCRVGTVELACGAATRHLRVEHKQTDDKPVSSLPARTDSRYGRGTRSSGQARCPGGLTAPPPAAQHRPSRATARPK